MPPPSIKAPTSRALRHLHGGGGLGAARQLPAHQQHTGGEEARGHEEERREAHEREANHEIGRAQISHVAARQAMTSGENRPRLMSN